MGHIRLGRIPKTKQWHAVLACLAGPEIDGAAISRAVAQATQGELRNLKGDSALSYGYWLLTRLVSAAREDRFVDALQELGIRTPSDRRAGIALLAEISQTVEREISWRSKGNALEKITGLALQQVLSEEITSKAPTLFGTTVDDVQTTLKEASSLKNFGRISRRFFAQFLSRTVKYIINKELSNAIGSRGLQNHREAHQLEHDIDRYCFESSRIVEEFSGGWFSKHDWESKHRISPKEAAGFVAYALDKLIIEFGGKE